MDTKKSNESTIVPVDFGIVYRYPNGNVSVLWEYNSALLKHLWGVEIAGVKISVREQKECLDWLKSKVRETKEKCLSIYQLQMVFKNRVLFNQALLTVEKLANIEVNLVDENAYYWSNIEKPNGNNAVAVLMETGETVSMSIGCKIGCRTTLE